ncbi:hypothetical protein FKW31_13000 [Acetobacter sp. DmW_136]|uniref:hypothetical protein n=1 Tax=Acetobacter sp. DmW_136 TaxID=2591091 RepID=UPI00123C187C|nr:hypothetical protein [Acetobacter sp. DmW_136]KAA8384454.1 hypothetical protein FKW31_13000 [Acetobacter sp. DmW_136]
MFSFISFHGHILAHRDFYLMGIPVAQAVSPQWNVVQLSADGNSLLGFADIRPHVEQSGEAKGLVSLKNGTQFMWNQPDGLLGWVPHNQNWERFAPVLSQHVPLLARLAQGKWLIAGKQTAERVSFSYFKLCLGEHNWDLRTLFLREKGDAIIISDGREPESVLQPSPLPVQKTFMVALAAQIKAMGESPFVQAAQAARQRLLVAPEDSGCLLDLAKNCAKIGQFGLARTAVLCAALQDFRPDLYLFSAILALREGETQQAADLANLALKGRFGDAPIPEQLTHLVQRTAQGEAALLLLPSALKELPDTEEFDPAFHFLMVPLPASMLRAEDVRQAYSYQFEQVASASTQEERLQLVQADQAQNRAQYWNQIVAGHYAWLNQDRASADPHYVTARKLSKDSGIKAVDYNCGVYTWLPEAAAYNLHEQQVTDQLGIAGWSWHSSVAPGRAEADAPDACLVFGCDSAYFRFVPKLVMSLMRACQAHPEQGRFRLCLGVDRATDEQLTLMRDLVAFFSEKDRGMDVSFTHGQLNHANKAAYTCIRYLMLPHIVGQWHCPVLTADCDGYFPHDFPALWQELKSGSDYGFRLYAYNHEGKQIAGEPWGFGAGLSYFGETELLPQIGRYLHNYVQRTYSLENPSNWCIDQCALAQAYSRFVAPRWNDLRIRFMDEGTPLMIMPHHVGGKDALLEHDGAVSEQDLRQFMQDNA